MLMLCFWLVGGLAVAGAATRIIGSAAVRSTLDQAGKVTDALQVTLLISSQLAIERAVVSDIFSLPTDALPVAVSRFQQARATTDATLERAARGRFPAFAPLQDIKRDLDKARDSMLSVLRKPVQQRGPIPDPVFVDAITDAQKAVNRIADGFERQIGLLSPDFAQLVGLARLSQTLREVQGLRAALLSGILAGAPVDVDTMRRIDELSGAAGTIWDRMRLTVAQMGGRHDVRTACDATRDSVMGPGEQLFRRIANGLRANQGSPMAVEEFRSWAPAMIANALLVRDAAFKAASAQRSSAVHAVIWQMWRDASMAVAALLIVVLASIQVMRRVARPLLDLARAVTAIADGDMDVPVPGADRRDELGEVAAAVAILTQRATAADRLNRQVAAEQARKIAVAAALADSARRFEDVSLPALAEVAATEAALSDAAQTINTAAALTAAEARGAAEGVSVAATSVAAVAAATEELAVSVRHVSDRMSVAATAAGSAAKGADKAAQAVGHLAGTARRIEDILRQIVDIAGRTNLLALNATIEAARAGESGRGFAVVASEVKKLASQTAKAAQDVSSHVTAILSATGEATTAIGDLSIEVSAVSATADDVASALTQQGAATQEIAQAAQAAAAGTDAATSKVANAALQTEAARASAMRLPQVSAAVGKATGLLRESVDTFVSEVRAVA